MIPLDLKHSKYLPSGNPFHLIKDLDRKFLVGEVRFYVYDLLLDDFCGNSNTPLELRNMEDVMDGG